VPRGRNDDKTILMERGGYIYILTNKNHTVLYTGVTSNIGKRLYEHRAGLYNDSFTSRYNVIKLVYYEAFLSIEEAIYREKQIKAGSRQKKLDLINGFNPEWKDLSGSLE
jgi:putative endonuclease